MGGGRPQFVLTTGYGSTEISIAASLRRAHYLEKAPIDSEDDSAQAYLKALRGYIAFALEKNRGIDARKLEVARALAKRCDLTDAEAHICLLIGSGATHDEIAAQRAVTVKTVHNQLGPLFEKVEPVVGPCTLERLALWISNEAHKRTLREG